MLIFWNMIFWTVAIGVISQSSKKYTTIDDIKINRVSKGFAFLLFAEIILFAGLRSGVADTHAYINEFNKLPLLWSGGIEYLKNIDKDIGYSIFSMVFKTYISDDYHVFLFVIALVSCLCIIKPLYKYSVHYTFSTFLFITTCYFIWLFNGMRQFIAATCLFLCIDFIVKKRTFSFIASVLILSTIHGTAIIMLPVYFFVHNEPWNKNVWIIIGVFLIGIVFKDYLIMVLDSILESTQYDDITQQFIYDDGVHLLRVLVAAVPIIMAYINKKEIQQNAPKYIKISINMSLLSVLFYAVGKVTSGIYVGRIPIYFELYNLILIPWLLKYTIKSKEKKLIYYCCIIGYLSFFYYQMIIAWDGFGYVSDILDINRRWMSNFLY